MRRALQIAALGLCATVSACAATGPEHPTYDEDVRPLLVARCIRCHDGKSKDPASVKTGNALLNAPGFMFDYPYLADVPSTTMTKLVDLARYTRGPVRLSDSLSYPRMPPVPAAVLEDWESQMLETWGKDPK